MSHFPFRTLSFLFILTQVACSSSGNGSDPAVGTKGDGDSSSTGGATSVGDGDGDAAASGGAGGPDCTGDCEPSGTGGTDSSGFKTTPNNKRVVGYLPMYRSLNPADIDFDTLTHLCLAFANPTDSGVDFGANPTTLQTLIDAAHDKGVYVLASIAGAAGGQAVEDAIQPGSVDGYIAELLSLIDRYDLDGIDVDIEGNHVASTYEPFVLKLSAALPEGKLLTAAVATWNGSDFSDAALAEYDFINLMSYDHCGSWSDACEHSTYEEAISELNYWENVRGIGVGNVTLGVPFYGYCWGPACPGEALIYPDILAGYPAARESDYLTGDGYTISFNGADTIAQKTQLATEHGGIMIWELGQDARGEDSLLQVIADNL